jgi:hypothetical protein
VDKGDWLAERFEEKPRHLRTVAYRMLGSLSEADDAVQEAWLRLKPLSVLGFTVKSARIAAIDILADPARLSRLDLPMLDA